MGSLAAEGKGESSHQLETNISKVQCLESIRKVNGGIHGLIYGDV